MSDTFALLFGAAIVFFFSYDRFNLATYEGDGRIDRLVALVSPDKLRARGTVLKAFLCYAAMLLIIYFFLCAYAELIPMLGGPNIANETTGASQLPDPSTAATQLATGFTPVAGGAADAWAQQLSGNTSGADSTSGIGIDPSVSLTVALIVVGLAPTFPVLKRFDEWMRSVAHQMAGIPTWVVDASNQLRSTPLGIPKTKGKSKDETLLIPPEDWARLERYRIATKKSPVESSADFWVNLELVLAASSWILDERLALSKAQLRERFVKLEKALHERKENLVQRLEGLVSSPSQIASKDESQSNSNDAPENTASHWEAISKTLDELAADFRILIALYVEHGIIDHRSHLPDNNPSHRSQHDAAMAVLLKYADIVRDKSDANPGTFTTPALVWTLGVTIAVTLAWSVFPGHFETEMQRGAAQSVYWRGSSYVSSALTIYGLTLLVALALRNGLRRTTQQWAPMVPGSHWTRLLPQCTTVLIIAWSAATAFIVAVSIWQSALGHGWPAIKADPLAAMAQPFEYNAPTTLRGAILALLVVALLDAHRSGYAATVARRISRLRSDNADKSASGTKKSRTRWPVAETCAVSLDFAAKTAAIMLFVGMVTRFASFYLGAAEDGASIEFEETDGKLTGVMIYAGIHSALIGFLVVFCVSEVLFHRRRALQERSQQGAGSDASG